MRRPRRRLHWRDEEGPDRLRAVSAIAGADVTLVGVVGSPLDPKRQERARRKCLERLFFQFGGEPCLETVWIESRTASLNDADRRMVVALRGSRLISGALRCEFALPSADPMLWAADALAGAVAASYRGEAVYREVLEPRLRVDELDLGG